MAEGKKAGAAVPRKKTAGKSTRKKTVLFVCTGNTCRSPMAEAIFRDELAKRGLSGKVRAVSAGLAAEAGAPVSVNAVLALKETGVPPPKHRARQLTAALLGSADLVVCMTENHLRSLAGAGDKVRSVARLTGGGDVADPYGQDLEAYRSVARYLRYACGDIMAALNAVGEKIK